MLSSSSSSSRSTSPEVPLSSHFPNQSAMTDAELEALPVTTNLESQNCSICYADINENTIRLLPCAHAFHEQCIFPWLKIHPSCPLCRHMLKQPQQYVSEDQVRLWQLVEYDYQSIENILPGTEWSSGPARNTRSRILLRTMRDQS